MNQWLLKLANRGPDTGWPPPENLDYHAWKYILGGRPISWWVHVNWQIEELNIRFETLARNSRRIVNDLIEAHINGVMNFYSASPDSRIRFLSAMRYLKQHGVLPRPLITFRARDGLSVLDGNHRMTALCVYRAAPELIAQGGTRRPPSNIMCGWVHIQQANSRLTSIRAVPISGLMLRSVRSTRLEA